MDILRYLLTFVEAICCALLIGVILIQKSKGGGLGAGFGQAMGESIFGTQMGNVLTKTTVILGIVFLVNTTVLALIHSGREGGSLFEDEPDLPVQQAPATPQGMGGGAAPTAPASDPGAFDFGDAQAPPPEAVDVESAPDATAPDTFDLNVDGPPAPPAE